ncbi:MAG: hypothetical protein CL609_22605 [Anaerolineaceae bacterium]|jgi:CRP-like cAMP-binding protein|nr:hypothetical protein [Anaerolineaceae bacterium]
MKNKTEIRPSLDSIPWFFDLTPKQISQLEKISGLTRLESGETLYLEGDNDNLLYVISEGKVAIDIHVPTHGDLRIYHAEPLDIIGWSSMTPMVRQRPATVTAVQPSCLIYFDGPALMELCDQDEKIGYIIMRRLSNIIASRLLTMRNQLFDLLIQNNANSG